MSDLFLLDVAGGLVLAAEGISPDSAMAKLVAPVGILIFVGSIYLLLRSNLGTRRGYYVLGVSTFGFLFIMSLFWGFGAPGTPQATGPTNLPGQPADALQPKWIPFAQDSLLADRADLSIVREFPEGFGPVPADEADRAEQGETDLGSFFSSSVAGQPIRDTWAVVDTQWAVTSTGLPVIGVTYQAVDDALQPIPDGPTYTAFGFFDAGNPLLPSIIFAVVSFLLFVLHAWLLDRDEQREKAELAAARAATAEPEPVPVEA
jgi:hypothetical protein